MNAKLRSLLGCVGFSAGLLSVAGCPSTAGDGGDTNNLRQTELPVGGGRTGGVGTQLGDGSVRQITDGTSNTVQVGELPPGDPAQTAPGSGGGAPSTDSATLAAIQTQLADRIFHFARSSGNSDNNAFVTGVNDLELCGFGRFGFREFTSFTSSVGDFSSEDLSNGTWTLRAAGGDVFVVLSIEQSTDENAPASRELLLQTDGAGNFAFNGSAADSEDAAADCAAAEQQP